MSKSNEKEQEVKPIAGSILDILLERGYTVIGRIGKGSYATVYVTNYQPEGCEKKTILACKMIDTKKVPKHFAKKFLPREIDVMKKVQHPNIIAVHSIFAQSTIYVIFMSYASKGDLLNFIVKNGAIKERQAYVWFRQAIEAVNYLHEKGITHRDLKCENLLLTSKFVIKLTDFGFSKFIVFEKGEAVKSKTYCGSISYAPPELITGLPYDAKASDMWSMGVVLFVMLNKAMPFDDRNLKHLYESQIQKNWHFRDKVEHFLSDDVKFMVMKLLQPNPKERWNTEAVLQSNWFIKNLKMSHMDVAIFDEETSEIQSEDEETIETHSVYPEGTSWSTQMLSRKLKKNTLL